MKHVLHNFLLVVLCAACSEPTPPTAGMPRMERTSSTYNAVVTQVLDAGSYTYAHVEDGTGAPRWVVTLHRELAAGAAVTIRVFGTRDAFCSARLNRCFDHLEFGTLGVREGT